MSIIPGTLLGSYEIAGPLGAGGMGEVYRARDRKLNRDVAIKILPESVALDPVRLARFEREARTLAALNHPHIAQIYGLEDAGARGKALVMELIGGQTLAERIAGGAMPIAEALEIARQIADALECAHAEGIVHRDLKPANIKVRDDGTAKVLDFGLAKGGDSGAVANLQDSPTFTSPAMTERGVILGTAAYMSPEQARGKSVDKRADIWAFGVIVFEMLTGRPIFAGETVSDTLAAVLREDVPWTSLPVATPAALRRLLERTLQKDPKRRLRDIGDAKLDIEDAITGKDVAAAPGGLTVSANAPKRLPWALAAVALLAAIVTTTWALTRSSAKADETTYTQITDSAGEETAPNLSPDGNTVLFASKARGTWDIYSQRVGGRNRTLVVGDPARHEGNPVFSPDGRQIAFHESDDDGGIFVAGATGESVRRLTNLGFHPTWSPDGRQVAFSTEEIVSPYGRQGDSAVLVVDVAGGSPRVIDRGDGAQPSWSPSGARIVFWSNDNGQRDLYTVPALGGARTPLLIDIALDWCPAWAPDGRSIVFASDRGGSMNLWRIAIDEKTGRPGGTPVRVTSGVQAAAECASFAADGGRFAFRSRVSALNPVAVPFDPQTLKAGTPVPLDSSNNVLIPSQVSPDGRWPAMYNLGDRQEDLFITPVGSFQPRRVTDDEPRDRSPVWMPDGQSLVFYSTRGGRWELWSVNSDGGNLRKVASLPDGNLVSPLIAPAGDRIAFGSVAGGDAYVAQLANGVVREASATAITNPLEGGVLNLTSWSRDGRQIAGSILRRSGRPAFIVTYDVASRRLRKLNDDLTFSVQWLPDSRRVLYVTAAAQLVVADVVTGARKVIPAALPGFKNENINFALTSDGRMIYYGGERSESDIWIAERPQR